MTLDFLAVVAAMIIYRETRELLDEQPRSAKGRFVVWEWRIH